MTWRRLPPRTERLTGFVAVKEANRRDVRNSGPEFEHSRAMPESDLEFARDLCAFINAAPSPYHAVEQAIKRLERAGFAPAEQGGDPAGDQYRAMGGSLLAWRLDDSTLRGFDIVGAHTDSPNLRIKPQPDRMSAGMAQVGVEVYGGALLNSWLDRDLGISGRVSVRDGDSADTVLLCIDEPVARVPQLAIHLDRDINEAGLKLNRQSHVVPATGIGSGPALRDRIAAELGLAGDDVLAWDLMLHEVYGSRIVGFDGDMIAGPRIDNLLSCHTAVETLRSSNVTPGRAQVIVLFDHEEIGSTTAHGASSSWLRRELDALITAAGESPSDVYSGSRVLSLDNAHATHPNYPERHEPEHNIVLNGGPVLKVNANARYATDAETGADFVLAAERAGVPLQRFVNRTDLACGSTIGPLSSAALGVPAVDVGAPQLAMHSARETTGASDPAMLAAATAAWLDPSPRQS